MRRVCFIFFSVSITGFALYGQSSSQISDPIVNYNHQKLTIQYKLTNNKKKVNYFVWSEINGPYGKNINTKSLTGDYGLIKNNNNTKQIIWDMGKDSVVLDGEITVQLKAEVLPRLFSKPAELGLSALLPGWGLSRIHKGKPYWLLGVAGYGCITTSVILNRQASQNYQSYLNTEVKQESDRLFEKAMQQDRLSESLAWAAAGIWAANLLWVVVTPNHAKPTVDIGKWSVKPAFSMHKEPMIALKYNF